MNSSNLRVHTNAEDWIPLPLSEATIKRFDVEVCKYPSEQKLSAVMACLSIIQQEQGWVSPEAEVALANYLKIERMSVHEVLTFYNMYNQQPVGKYKLNVCTNLPCLLRGGQEALDYLRNHLKTDADGHDASGLFTIQASECLGACADAPVLLVNDRKMCSYMTHPKLDQLITALKQLEDQHVAG